MNTKSKCLILSIFGLMITAYDAKAANAANMSCPTVYVQLDNGNSAINTIKKDGKCEICTCGVCDKPYISWERAMQLFRGKIKSIGAIPPGYKKEWLTTPPPLTKNPEADCQCAMEDPIGNTNIFSCCCKNSSIDLAKTPITAKISGGTLQSADFLNLGAGPKMTIKDGIITIKASKSAVDGFFRLRYLGDAKLTDFKVGARKPDADKGTDTDKGTDAEKRKEANAARKAKAQELKKKAEELKEERAELKDERNQAKLEAKARKARKLFGKDSNIGEMAMRYVLTEIGKELKDAGDAEEPKKDADTTTEKEEPKP